MVEVIVTHKFVRVKAPYHPEFPSLARAMQGQWDKATKRWTFPASLEEDVREILIDIYGTDSDNYESVDVVYRVSGTDAQNEKIVAFGRQLVRRYKFNRDVGLSRDVTLFEGNFPMKAGSHSKPRLGGAGTRLLVRSIPRLIAEKAMDAAPEFITIY